MSYVIEVIADNSGKWFRNGLRFANKQEAEEYGFALALRWILVRDWRVVESTDKPNHGNIFLAGKVS
jgi:hypothetical protein